MAVDTQLCKSKVGPDRLSRVMAWLHPHGLEGEHAGFTPPAGKSLRKSNIQALMDMNPELSGWELQGSPYPKCSLEGAGVVGFQWASA